MDTKTVNETAIIVDALTGEVTVREFTETEKAQRQIDLLAETVKNENRAAQLLVKQSAQTKLAALGLTEEEVASILG